MIGDTARIEHDLFGIAARLRAIDDGYFVVYDRRKCAFEVHNSRQRGSTLALSVPYPRLDARTVTLVRKTRAENAKRLFEEMERENERRQHRQEKETIERLCGAIDAAQKGERG